LAKLPKSDGTSRWNAPQPWPSQIPRNTFHDVTENIRQTRAFLAKRIADMAGRTNRPQRRSSPAAVSSNSSPTWLAKFIASDRSTVHGMFSDLTVAPKTPKEWFLYEKISEPRTNNSNETRLLSNLRRTPDHQAWRAQEQPSPTADLLVQGLRTLLDWTAGYRSITTFHRLRDAAVLQFGQAMVRERTLDHQQEYQFKVHVAKLALTANTVPQGVSAKVERYLFSVFEDFPDYLFQQHGASDLGRAPLDTPSDSPTAMRSSKSCFETLPFARIAKQNLANDLAALGLLLARKSKDRHSSVQDFMLANDSCTIACEVPVYLTAAEIASYKAQASSLHCRSRLTQ
jgi:hypothetical protein